MSLLDLIAIAVILILAIRGVRRGLIGEIMETVGVLGAAYLTYKFYPVIAGLFKLPTTGSVIMMIGGFVAAFLIVFVAVSIVGLIVRGLIRKIKLGPIDKVLGFVLGMIKGVVIVIAISGGLKWIGDGPGELVKNSTVASTLVSVAEKFTSGDEVQKLEHEATQEPPASN